MTIAKSRGRRARAARLAPALVLLLCGGPDPVAAQGWREGRARDAAAACRDRAEAVVRARGAGREAEIDAVADVQEEGDTVWVLGRVRVYDPGTDAWRSAWLDCAVDLAGEVRVTHLDEEGLLASLARAR
jgi:hypothetical protein